MFRSRLKALLRKPGAALAAGLVVLLVSGLLVFFLFNTQQTNETVRGSALDFWGKSPMIHINNADYPFNPRVSNYLFLGTDQRVPQGSIKVPGRSNGQADFLLLLCMDHQQKTARFLQIDRDTMADIIVLSVMGEESGTRQAQICLAHSFGDSPAESASLTARAVSALLGDVPIAHITAMNMDKIASLVDFVGGVSLTPDQDYPMIDSRLVKGKTIRMDGELASRFVRQRMDVDDGSNASRMDRQRLFVQGLAESLSTKAKSGGQYWDEFYDFLTKQAFTSMTKGAILNLSNQLADYQSTPITSLSGTHEKIKGFIEFHPDENNLTALVTDWFVTKTSP